MRLYIMDELEQVKNKVSIIDYVQRNGIQVKSCGGGKYRANPCPKCGHNDHFTLYKETNTYSSFNNCCEGGDILNYMQEVEGLTFQEAKAKLYSITNTPLEEYKKTARKQQEKPQEKKPTQEELQEIKEFINRKHDEFMQNQDEQDELIGYLATRYIDEDAIYKYHLFLCEDKANQKRLYIPIYEQGQPVAYIGRAIDSNAQYRYLNSRGTIQPFHIDYLSREAEQEDEPLFICEGVFDAISIEEQGKKAIALNSTQNVEKLCNTIKKHLETAKKYRFIIATDNDTARHPSKREPCKRIDKARHRKHLFADTKPVQGCKRVVL